VRGQGLTTITSFTEILIACVSLGITAGTAVGASLTITPSTVATDYTGPISLDITELARGQAVLVTR
jgi:hypothetical protein